MITRLSPDESNPDPADAYEGFTFQSYHGSRGGGDTYDMLAANDTPAHRDLERGLIAAIRAGLRKGRHHVNEVPPLRNF